jgi:hypothetical protein
MDPGHTLCLLPRQRETTTRWRSTSSRFPWDPTVRIVCVVGVGLVTATTPQLSAIMATDLLQPVVAICAQIRFVDKS